MRKSSLVSVLTGSAIVIAAMPAPISVTVDSPRPSSAKDQAAMDRHYARITGK